MGVIDKVKRNMFLRNAVMAICILIILLFVAQIGLSVITRHGQKLEVPDFGGMTVKEARDVAKNASLKIEINDSLYLPMRTGGIVLEQNPSRGAKVKSGRRVFVTINSFNPKTAQIPYVAGYSLRQAKNNLEMAGFSIDKLVYREDIATNNVLEQRFGSKLMSAASKIEAPTGSGVILIVGLGENSVVSVPKITGFPLKEAKSRLQEIGLNVGNVVKDKGVNEINITDAKVYRQSPVAGESLQLGTDVDIFVSLEDKK